MKAVILAGGLGTRLRPLTDILPKPLLPVGKRSVLEIMITKLKDFGFDELYIATGYKSHLLENYFGDGSRLKVKIKFSKERTPLGTAGPLKLLQKELKEPFPVMYGDIITSLNFKNLRKFHLNNKSDFTLVTKKIFLPISYGLIKSKGNLIKKIEEKPLMKSEINTGIYYVNPEIVNHIPSGFFHMTDLAKLLIRKNKKVMRYRLREYWIDIGEKENYEKVQKKYEGGEI